MGRGLSDLQKELLRLAYQHRQQFADDLDDYRARFGRSPADPRPDDLHSHEAMIALFGCVGIDRYPYDRSRAGRLLDRFGGQRVSITDTGSAKYRSAAASVHRAFTRLEARGLVERPWYGVITLTDAGIDVAQSLTVETADSCPYCQPLAETEQSKPIST